MTFGRAENQTLTPVKRKQFDPGAAKLQEQPSHGTTACADLLVVSTADRRCVSGDAPTRSSRIQTRDRQGRTDRRHLG
jgi:hypothetical protein